MHLSNFALGCRNAAFATARTATNPTARSRARTPMAASPPGDCTVSAMTEYVFGVRHTLRDGELRIEEIDEHVWGNAREPSGFFNFEHAENVSAVTIVTGADVDLPAQALTYSVSGGTDNGTIVGSGSLTKVGVGTLTLGGANSYGGVTTVSAGVLNVRNGLRGVAYGDSDGSDQIELRYMATNADFQEGDLLTTSGIDGVFPPGLPVARVSKIERRSESIFARILCQPIALIQGVRHVMVISSVGAAAPERPAADPVPAVKKAGRR